MGARTYMTVCCKKMKPITENKIEQCLCDIQKYEK